MFPLQIGIPGGPELLIILLVTAVPLLAAYLAYRTGRSAGDEDAVLWAAVIGTLTSLGFLPGVVVLGAYSYVRGE